MKYINHKISGIPYGKRKNSGNVEAPEKWTQAIIEQTEILPKITEACILRVTFLLPPNKFPLDLPYGPDLDNLMKRFCDALNETIFCNTNGKDSCIIEMGAMKTKVTSEQEAGALLEVLPVSIK